MDEVDRIAKEMGFQPTMNIPEVRATLRLVVALERLNEILESRLDKIDGQLSAIEENTRRALCSQT